MDYIEERRRKYREYYAKKRKEICAQKAEYRKTEQAQKLIKGYHKGDTYRAQKAEYAKTDNGKKLISINRWKQYGVKHNNFDDLYKIWKEATNCADCDVVFVEGNKGNNRKCLDHDHTTGLFRDIICHKCNIHRGVIDRLSALNL